jgi:hypothetical protein
VAHICKIERWQQIYPVWMFQAAMVAIFVAEKLCAKDADALEALDQAFRLLSLSSVICELTRLRRLPLRQRHSNGRHFGYPHIPC